MKNKYICNNKNNNNDDNNYKINLQKLYLICKDGIEPLTTFISSNEYDSDAIQFDINNDGINNQNNDNYSNLFKFFNDNNFNKYWSLIIIIKKKIAEKNLVLVQHFIKEPKHSSLKQELLSNNIYKMALNKFIITLNKAFYIKHCQLAKQLKSRDNGIGNNKFEIPAFSPISINHLQNDNVIIIVIITEINDNDNDNNNSDHKIDVNKLYLICKDSLKSLEIFISSNEYDSDSLYFDIINNNDNNNKYCLLIINKKQYKKVISVDNFYWKNFDDEGDKYIENTKSI